MHGQFYRDFEEKADVKIIVNDNAYKFLGVEQTDGIQKGQVLQRLRLKCEKKNYEVISPWVVQSKP